MNEIQNANILTTNNKEKKMARVISTKNLSREEWLKARKSGIGGSDISAILGLNPYRTKLDVYLDKINPIVNDIPANPRMKAGTILEEAIGNWWGEENDAKVRKDNKIRFHRKHPFMLANIDRLYNYNKIKEAGILEVKNTNSYAHNKWVEQGLDFNPMWYAQVQHYMAVTGHEHAIVTFLLDGYDLQSFPVKRDETFIKMIEEEAGEFWNKNIKERITPEPVNEADVIKLYPKEETGKVAIATDTELEVFNSLKAIKDQIKVLEAEQDMLTEQLKLSMMDAEVLEFNGAPLATWKYRQGHLRVDGKRLMIEKPDVFTEYAEMTKDSRTFLLKNIKG